MKFTVKFNNVFTSRKCVANLKYQNNNYYFLQKKCDNFDWVLKQTAKVL